MNAEEITVPPTIHRRRRLTLPVVVAWCVATGICLAADGITQPWFAAIGRDPTVRSLARNWQRCAEGFGIAAFVAAVAIGRRRLLLPAIYSLLGVAAFGQTAKYLIGRVRPNHSEYATIFGGRFGWWLPPKPVAIDSFPSGHTAAAFAMAYVLAMAWPRHEWLWCGAALGVAAARTLLNVHFLSDVMCGALLGTLLAAWACRMHQEESPSTAAMTHFT